MESNLKSLAEFASGKIMVSKDPADNLLTEEEKRLSMSVVRMATSMAAVGLRESDLLEVLKVSGLDDRAQKITAYRVGIILASKMHASGPAKSEGGGEIKVRDAWDIQHAHDLLHVILDGAIPRSEVNPFNSHEDQERAHAAMDALCWVLHHKSGDEFATHIAKLNGILEKAGYHARRKEDVK